MKEDHYMTHLCDAYSANCCDALLGNRDAKSIFDKTSIGRKIPEKTY